MNAALKAHPLPVSYLALEEMYFTLIGSTLLAKTLEHIKALVNKTKRIYTAIIEYRDWRVWNYLRKMGEILEYKRKALSTAAKLFNLATLVKLMLDGRIPPEAIETLKHSLEDILINLGNISLGVAVFILVNIIDP